jgi:hypothetical protein
MADKKVRITPQLAVQYLNDAAAQHHGTRDDHRVLEASVALLQQVVTEWQMFRDAAEAAEKLENLEVVGDDEVVNDE